MKLLRKKIQKRNEKNKKRKLLNKEAEEEETGMCGREEELLFSEAETKFDC